MRLLLDTHVALWAIADSVALVPEARRRIEAPENSIFVSVVSVWEIAVKHGLQRSNMPLSGADALNYFRQAGYQLLAVQAEHAVAVEDLPRIHADPFDRLLVAQAILEPLRLVTHDRTVARYSDSILYV